MKLVSSLHRSPAASFWLLLLAFACLATSQLALAASTRPRPFRRISRASDVAIDLVSRQPLSSSPSSLAARQHANHERDTYLPRRLARAEPIHHSDTLRLTFRAFDQLFHLHLEPNTDLVHPDGIIVNKGQASQQHIARHDVRAYHGIVIQEQHSARRTVRDAVGVKHALHSKRASILESSNDEGVVGRASIMIHDDGSLQGRSPSFEGTFDWNGNIHYISSAATYSAIRSELDPALPPSQRDLEGNSIIVHRMSDMLSHDEEASLLAARGVITPQSNLNVADAGCSADAHDFNTNNHLLLTDKNNDEFSISPINFFVAKSASPSQLFSRALFRDLIPGRRAGSDVEGEPLEARDAPSRFSYSAPVRRQTGNDIAGNGANASYTSDIGSTTGCPTSARVVYVGLAADCSYSARFGGDEGAVRSRLLSTLNDVSSIYRSTFNISLGATALEVRGSSCPSSASGNEAWNVACSSSIPLDQRLSDFSRWRGTQDGSTGLWHLLTACATGTEVGVAWLGTVCRTDVTSNGADSVSGTGVTASTTIEAQVVAHEIGHNFGAVHDCTNSCSLSGSSARQGAQFGGAVCCPFSTSSCNAGGGFIMNPSSGGDATAFSPCSIGNICTLLGRGLNTSCIVPPGQRSTLSAQQCGNGILEPGEECDAGPNGSPCCTSQCRFTSGAVCDPTTSACCTSSCSFASNSTVCRPAVDGRCDIQETCPGNSAECPADETRPDGTDCASGLQCAAGVCTSRDLQCQQAGSSLGLSRACPTSFDTGCSIACRDPSSSASCLVLQQTFTDGTPCRWGGRCQNGDCQTGSWQDVFQGWYRDNLRISIPVTIVVGIIILVILWAIAKCIFRGCRGGGKTAPSSAYRHRRGRSGGNSRPPSGWVDPSPWNGPNGYGNGQGGGPGYAASQPTQPYYHPDMGYAPPSEAPPPPPPRR